MPLESLAQKLQYGTCTKKKVRGVVKRIMVLLFFWQYSPPFIIDVQDSEEAAGSDVAADNNESESE